MSKLVIGVDVDIVLAQSDLKWAEWLVTVTRSSSFKIKAVDGKLLYNTSEYFKEELEDLAIDPMDFWRNEGVYDWIKPVHGSVDALQYLKDTLDCDIVAISHCKGNHFKSKWQFLKRYFGDNIEGFVATKEKHYVAVDYMIDDRYSYLNRMPENVKKICLETPYTQDVEPDPSILHFMGWKDIADYIRLKEDFKEVS